MKIDVMGIQFDNVTMEEAVARAAELIAQPGAAYVVTPNAEIAYECLHDEKLLRLINGADLILPDGSGVVLGAKLLHTPLKEKVAGVEFADHLAAWLAEHGKTLYLLGSKPGVGEQAAAKLRERYPALQIVGIADGYFQSEEAAVAAVNEKKPDVLFVCLGAPKQEQFMQKYQKTLDVRLMAGLGGTLDSIAGTVKRAPRWMIRLNLEWLYRLIKQPSRLGRMMRLPKYVFAVLRHRKGK